MFDKQKYALRAYWQDPRTEEIAELKEHLIFTHSWFLHFSTAVLHASWRTLTPEERETWWQNLPANHAAITLLMASYPGSWIENADSSEKWNWLGAAACRQAYKQLTEELRGWAGAITPRPTVAQVWQHLEVHMTAENPWVFLLLKGLPHRVRPSNPCPQLIRNGYLGHWPTADALDRLTWLVNIAGPDGLRRPAYKTFFDAQRRLQIERKQNNKPRPSANELWDAVEAKASNSPWLQLLLNGLPFELVPPLPPSVYEQIRVIEEAVGAEQNYAPPLHCWAKG